MTTSTLTGGTSSGLTVGNGDFLLVSSGGVAVATVVSGGGVEDVSTGGVASLTMVLGQGTENVFRGGILSGSVVSDGGTENVSSGGVAVATVLRGGEQFVFASGTASGTEVSAGGIVAVSSGGVTTFITVSSGGVQYVLADGQADGTTISASGLEILFGGLVSGTILGGDATQEVRAAGAVASSTVVRGEEYVFSGGTAIGSVISQGGFDEAESSGTVSDVIVSGGGAEFVFLGGVASGTVVSNGGVEVVSRGTARGTELTNGGSQTISDGGVASSTVVIGGYQDVYSGGLASTTTVSGGGTATVFSSGAASLTALDNGGYLVVSNGGTAKFTTVGVGAYEVLSLGGSATSSTVDLGGMIDVAYLPFASGGSAGLTPGGLLTVSIGGQTYTQQLAGTYGGEIIEVAPDTGSGTLITMDEGPRTLVWTGSSGTGFSIAADWDDITNTLDPALTAPGAIDTAEFLTGGDSIGGTGTVAALDFGGLAQWLLGASSTLSAAGTVGVTVGVGGSGLLSLTNGATIISQGTMDTISGDSPQGAMVTVNGTASTWSSDGELLIGGAGLGALAVQADGTVTAGSGLVIANTTSASGSSVSLAGAGSNVQITGLLDVGAGGSGALDISGGASVSAASLDDGVSPTAVGQIGLSGAGTGLSITGAATVADAGTGVLSVLSGATFSAASLTIGANKGSSGAVIVSGADSDLVIAGALNIGTALGIGDLTVGPSAAVHASVINLEGQVVLEGGLLDPSVTVINPNKSLGGSGTVASGDIIDEGILQAGDGTPGQLELVRGTIVGGGTLTENGSKVANKANAVGVLQINTFGTMEVDGAVLNAATTTFANDVTPTTTYTVTHSVIDVNFEDSTGVLQLDDIGGFDGTIATFQAGDQFIIAGGTLSGLGVNNGTTLTMNDSGNGGTDQIIFNSQVSASYFNIVNGNSVDVVACFAADTRIGTVDGLVRVEELRVGDRLMTVDGACEPIVWSGSRTVHCESHPNPKKVWPVRIARGAFGLNGPRRDLNLSPDHAVFVNNVLVPVKLLINGTSIVQVEREKVRYFHIELPRHAVILAEGLPVESYLDLGDRADFICDGGVVRLFPDFTARLGPDAAAVWETKGAAPLVLGGKKLREVRNVVAEHAMRYPAWPMRTTSGDRPSDGPVITRQR